VLICAGFMHDSFIHGKREFLLFYGLRK